MNVDYLIGNISSMTEHSYFPVILIIGYFFLAVMLKYTDEAFDGLTFSKKKAIWIMPFALFLWLLIVFLDRTSSVILVAYLLATVILKKIDLEVYKIALFVFTIFFFMFGIYKNILSNFGLFCIIFFLSIIDEKGNAYADKYFLFKNNDLPLLFAYFFKFRLSILVGSVMLSYFGVLPALYVIAILAWTIGYNLVIHLSRKMKKPKMNNVCHRKSTR